MGHFQRKGFGRTRTGQIGSPAGAEKADVGHFHTSTQNLGGRVLQEIHYGY